MSTTVITPTELEIRVERIFDAPRTHVYFVWTDPQLSVIVIAHHQAVMAHADWIIDLGPGAGHAAAGSPSRAHPPTSSPPAPP